MPKEVRAAKSAAWRAQRDADKEARAKYLRYASSYSLKKRYGLSDHQIVELAEHQNGVCAICGVPPDTSRKRGGLHVDHDHSTGEIRGLLCERCNHGLGHFKDNSEVMEAAIKYLQAPPATKVQFTESPSKPSFQPSKRNPEKRASLKLTCKQCGETFRRKAQAEYASRAKGKEGPFCSRECSGTWGQAHQNVKGLIHGTTNGYTYYKCRCKECRKAHADAERARRKRK